MPSQREVASLEKLTPGMRMLVEIDGKNIALFNVDGTVYAIDDSCVHQGSSLIVGKLDGLVVTCPGHGLRFDLTTGETSPGYGVASYPVTIDGKKIVLTI